MGKSDAEEFKLPPEVQALYDRFNERVLRELEQEHGKQWVKDNWEMLERDRVMFEGLGLL